MIIKDEKKNRDRRPFTELFVYTISLDVIVSICANNTTHSSPFLEGQYDRHSRHKIIK